MTTRSTRARRRLVATTAAVTLSLGALTVGPSAAVGIAPAPPPSPGPMLGQGLLPATTTCSTAGCDLFASVGSTSLGGASMPVWGFTADGLAPTAPGGPTLVVRTGDTVTINLHNRLPAGAGALALNIPALAAADTGGVAAGGDRSYTFTPTRPGSYLYEAGPGAGGDSAATKQVAMGLYGALVVEPAGGQGADDEAVLVLSEFDPRLAANPAAFDMRTWAPRYRLINGAVAPDVPVVQSNAGKTVLLRYVNAGLEDHSMGLLGVRQTLQYQDARRIPDRSVVAETVAPGQSLDATVLLPAGSDGQRFAIHEANNAVNAATVSSGGAGGGTVAYGGMLSYLQSGTPQQACTGPAASRPAISTTSVGARGSFTIGAQLESCAAGAAVTAAGYTIDNADPAGAVAMAVPTGGAAVDVTATVDLSLLTAQLSSGMHSVLIFGRDSSGAWGAPTSALVYVDSDGPPVTNLAVTPDIANGAISVAVTADASDTTTGDNGVAGASVCIDRASDGSCPGSYPMTVATTPVTGLFSLARMLPTLPAGRHTVDVVAVDGLGNAGPASSATLLIDTIAPGPSPDLGAGSVQVSPNNGTIALSSGSAAVRVDALFQDPLFLGSQSNVEAAEMFIDGAAQTNGGGITMLPTGLFDSPTEGAYALVPLGQIAAMTQGQHSAWVHAKDAAGNWGVPTALMFVVDHSAPTGTLVADPAYVPGSRPQTVSLHAVQTDPPNTSGGAPAVDASASDVTSLEYWVNADPGAGNGIPVALGATPNATADVTFSVDLGGIRANSTNSFSVRSRDSAGNWSLPTTLTIANMQQPNGIFANAFSVAGSTQGWAAATGAARLMVVPAPGLPPFSLQVRLRGAAAGYVTDTTPAGEQTYRAAFQFSPNSARMGAAGERIFVGLTPTNSRAFAVAVRRTAAGVYQVSGSAANGPGTVTSAWTPITDASHLVEVDWSAVGTRGLQLYVDGSQRAVLRTPLNGAVRIESVQLGATGGMPAGSSGAQVFDSFVSTRYTRP